MPIGMDWYSASGVSSALEPINFKIDTAHIGGVRDEVNFAPMDVCDVGI